MTTNTPALAKGHNSLPALINSAGIQSRFREVLGKRAPQFISSVLQVGHTLGPDCDPHSIIGGAMQAATLDLPINKNLGFAWLVPFRDKGVKKAQFQMGYRGYIQLALRTGQYARMNAGAINRECVGGWDEVGERVLDFSKYDPRKPAAGYFFAFRMVNGYTKVAYWSKEEVEEHARRYSQSYRGGYDSPWKTHFDEMATKTVIANELRQWGILSVEMQSALASDSAIIEGIDNPAFTYTSPDDTAPLAVVEAAAEVQPEAKAQAEPVADDGDLGPARPTKGAKAGAAQRPAPADAPATDDSAARPESAVTAAGTQGEPGDAERLEAAVSAAGYTFDQFARWADGVGMLADATSFAGFSDIPPKELARLLRPNILKLVIEGLGREFGKVAQQKEVAK
jgi:recombination protein RecT